MAPPPPFLPPSPSLPIRLTLPAHPSLALTPYTYNPAERADLVALQNQPVLARYNYGRAFPYTEAALDSFLARRGAGFDRGLGELLEWLGWGGDGEAGGASGREEEQPPIMMFPLACLRYLPPSPGPNTHEDGPADPLAALDLRPGQVVGLAFVYPSERHPSEKEGRAEQVFGLSYDIDERLHGQKVGKGMVQRLLEWTDWMGVRLLVEVQMDNPASVGLMKTSGFRLTKVAETEWPEQNGGGTRDLGQWVRPCGGWAEAGDPNEKVPYVPLPKADDQQASDDAPKA